jgi:hypothetical protein
MLASNPRLIVSKHAVPAKDVKRTDRLGERESGEGIGWNRASVHHRT